MHKKPFQKKAMANSGYLTKQVGFDGRIQNFCLLSITHPFVTRRT